MRSEPAAHDARIHAFRELYLREFAFVWATARRFGVQPALLEDAVQDVFLTAYRRLDQLRFEVSARAWLYGVTRKIAARYRRSAARLSRRLAAVAAVPRAPAEAPHDRVAAAEQLERLLERLGGKTRAAFEMSELYGMSGPEIAGELGIPVSTVYSRVRLAREQLERELGGAALERELAAARTRDTPPPAVVQRSWAALLPGLVPTHAGVGVGVGVAASTRAAVMTTLILAAGAVGVAWPRGQVSGEPRAVVGSSASTDGRGARRATGERGEPHAAEPGGPRRATGESADLHSGATSAASEFGGARQATGESGEPHAGAMITAGELGAATQATGESGEPHAGAMITAGELGAATQATGESGERATSATGEFGGRTRATGESGGQPGTPSAGQSPAVAAERDATAATRRGERPAGLERAQEAVDPDLLAAEVAVLDRARDALAEGALARAEAELAEHARRFPAGAFADLRGATEVELLCRQGRPREAAARANALVLAHPGSAVARRFLFSKEGKKFSCPE